MSMLSISVTLLLLSTLPVDLPSQPMKFWVAGTGGNCAWCVWIVAEGEITEHSAAAFEGLQYHGAPEVVFNSPGGSLIGGVLLGEAIRRRGLSTSVGQTVRDGNYYDRDRGQCLSSCALAFLGGTSRWAGDKELGVHQHYLSEALERPEARVFSALDLSEQQLINAIIIEYVYRMGADPRFASIAASIPPPGMYYFTRAELEELAVNYTPDELLPWTIEPRYGGAVAQSISRDGMTSITAFCRDDRIPRLLIQSSRLGTDFVRLRQAASSLGGISVFGIEYPSAAVTVTSVGALPALEILARGLDARQLREPLIRGDAPMVNYAYFSYRLPLTMAPETIRIALKNCHN